MQPDIFELHHNLTRHFEEVGLNPKFDFTFHQVDTYHLTKNRQKEVTFFLAEFIEGQQIKLQESEIRQSAWLSYDEAQKCLAAQNYKEFSVSVK